MLEGRSNSHSKAPSQLPNLPDSPLNYVRALSPSASTTALRSFEVKAAKLMEEVQFSTKMNKVRFRKNILESMQDDMVRAVETIRKLQAEKARYKEALRDVNRKKDELFQKATFYYNDWKNEVEVNNSLKKVISELEESNNNITEKNRELESALSKRKVQVEHMKYDLNKLDKMLREHKINQDAWEELVRTNKNLKIEVETLKAERSNGLNLFSESFKGSPLLHKITKMSEKLLMKIKEYSELNCLFSSKICKASEFRLFVMKQNWEECLYKLLQFVLEIICYQSEQASRSCTPIQAHKIAITQTEPMQEYSSYNPTDAKYEKSRDYDRFYSFNSTSDTRNSPSIGLNKYQNHPEDDYTKLASSSDQLLDTLSVQNDRLARLNHQIYQTMTSSKKLLNLSPVKLEFSDMRDSFDSLKSPYSMSFDRRGEESKSKSETILEASLHEEEEKTIATQTEEEKPRLSEIPSPKIKSRASLNTSKSAPKIVTKRKPFAKFDEYVSPVLRKRDGWGSVGDIFSAEPKTAKDKEAKEKESKEKEAQGKQGENSSAPSEANKE
jgi:hypothetical protein